MLPLQIVYLSMYSEFWGRGKVTLSHVCRVQVVTRLECDIVQKFAAHVGPSAPVHRVSLAMHQTALFLVVYGELHCGKNLAFIHKNANVKFGLDFMAHNTLLIEKVISIAFFFSPVTVFLCSCHLLHIQRYRQCSCHSAVRSCGTYFAGTSCAWHEPKEFRSCSATSLMICL